MDYIVKHKKLYYLLQFTWGLLMNIIGAAVFGALIVFGKKKPKKFGNCWYISVGKSWGGLELGTFFLTDSRESLSTKYHEAGHGLQNIVWGPLFPFVIGIPSALRYWYRKLTPNKKHKPYDSIWFEGQATEWGRRYYDHSDIEKRIGELFDGK
jgi:hypothetical protein